MNIMKNTIISPGDMLLVDFGSSSIRSSARGRCPAYVVSIDDGRAADSQMMLIPDVEVDG